MLWRCGGTACAPRPQSALASRDGGASALAGFYAVQLALSSIDRLEVRGRDSAGLHLFVWDHGLELDEPELAARLAAWGEDLSTPPARCESPTAVSCRSCTRRRPRSASWATTRLRCALRSGTTVCCISLSLRLARVAVLGHTCWASVGIISEPNAHPVNSDEDTGDGTVDTEGRTSSPR